MNPLLIFILIIQTVAESFVDRPLWKNPPTANYTSYFCICTENSTEVIFVNFALYNCSGQAWTSQYPLDQCLEDIDALSTAFSWIGHCNNTHMVFNNFAGTECFGKSLGALTYPTLTCTNCPNPWCGP